MNGDVDPGDANNNNHSVTDICEDVDVVDNGTDMASEVVSLRTELEKQQEYIGEIVQSYDAEVTRLNELVKQYEAQDSEKTSKKRKRNAESNITESLNTCEDVAALKEELRNLAKAVKEKDRSIDILQQRNESLAAILNERETELENTLTKINEESGDELRMRIRRLDEEKCSNEAYIDHLKQLTEKQETDLAAAKNYTCQLKEELQIQKGEKSEKLTDNNQSALIHEIQKINERFLKMETQITSIETKISNSQKESVENVKKSFADIVSKNQSAKTDSVCEAIRTAQNLDKIIETERTKRENNIVIHGVLENSDNETESKKADEEFVNSLISILGSNVAPQSITRLGKLDGTVSDKRRPLRLCMKNNKDKEQIMLRLSNLKNAEQKFKRISVKDDYTVEERDEIRRYQRLVDEKNKSENTTNWKLRGNPKNGLRIVKIQNRQEDSMQTTSSMADLIN